MTQIQFKSEIDVDYVQHMGSDDMILRAMLVSTNKDREVEGMTQSARTGRLNFLMEKRHGSPFECSALTVRVHAPIKVWREWHRHRVGWSYNETSGRYKAMEPIFWIPPPERPMIEHEGFKSSMPGFRPATPEEYEEVVYDLKAGYKDVYAIYKGLLEMKLDKGLARDVLGVGIFSTCYCTCNPRSIMHFLELRTMEEAAKRPSKPLWEIANAAKKLEEIFARIWPVTYELWNKHGRMAP